jgi:hypothetical protein
MRRGCAVLGDRCEAGVREVGLSGDCGKDAGRGSKRPGPPYPEPGIAGFCFRLTGGGAFDEAMHTSAQGSMTFAAQFLALTAE